jgi:hypothetical protein
MTAPVSAQRGVGLVILILVVAIVGAFVFGFSALKKSSSRLYRFTDPSGTVQFVDSLDKVPLEQRAAAAKRPDVAPINKVDFRGLVDRMVSRDVGVDDRKDAR